MPATARRTRPGSREHVRQLGVAAEARPAERTAAVQVVEDERVSAELEQDEHGFALPGLRGEVDGGYPLAVARPAEAAAPIRVGAELDERAGGGGVALHRPPGERRTAVRVCVHPGAALDQQADRLDAIGLGRPDERLVEHLLRIVGGLPLGEAAVWTIEAAVRS